MIRTIRYNQNTDVIELFEDDGMHAGEDFDPTLGRWAGYRAFAADDQDYALIVWLGRGTALAVVDRKFRECGMTRLP